MSVLSENPPAPAFLRAFSRAEGLVSRSFRYPRATVRDMLRTAAPVPPSPSASISRPLGLLGALGILCVVAVGVVVRSSGGGPSPIESWWHDLILGSRSDAAVTVARVFELVGGVPSVIVITLLLIAVFLFIRRFRDALTLAAVMCVSEAITAALKVAASRPRPADSISDVGLMSFPSGHTAAAAALAVTLALLLGRRFWAPAVGWIVLMAWSRTCLEAHWLGDVAAGAILGTSVALLVRWAVAAGERRMQSAWAARLTGTR